MTITQKEGFSAMGGMLGEKEKGILKTPVWRSKGLDLVRPMRFLPLFMTATDAVACCKFHCIGAYFIGLAESDLEGAGNDLEMPNGHTNVGMAMWKDNHVMVVYW